jgi:hypothetical protein
MALISVRNIGPVGDPLYGQGIGNFLTDIDACAQVIRTRLLLLQGEMWINTSTGLPLFQQILGRDPSAAATLLQQVIATSPYVTSISGVQTSYNRTTRAFAFSCLVQTQFGTILVQTPFISSSAGNTGGYGAGGYGGGGYGIGNG